MISLICGEKGSGKTIKMLEMANKSVESAKGEIVFVDVKESTALGIHRDIRFVNVGEFIVNNPTGFLGFISGLIAGNYDIGEIYVDNFLKITGSRLNDLENFFNDLNKIGEKYQVHFVFTASCNKEEIPSFAKKYMLS